MLRCVAADLRVTIPCDSCVRAGWPLSAFLIKHGAWTAFHSISCLAYIVLGEWRNRLDKGRSDDFGCLTGKFECRVTRNKTVLFYQVKKKKKNWTQSSVWISNPVLLFSAGRRAPFNQGIINRHVTGRIPLVFFPHPEHDIFPCYSLNIFVVSLYIHSLLLHQKSWLHSLAAFPPLSLWRRKKKEGMAIGWKRRGTLMDDDNTINTTYKARHKNCVRARPKMDEILFFSTAANEIRLCMHFYFAGKTKGSSSQFIFCWVFD